MNRMLRTPAMLKSILTIGLFFFLVGIVAGESEYLAFAGSDIAVIPNPENLIFRAGISIELQIGFKVEPGASFTALIENCQFDFHSEGQQK